MHDDRRQGARLPIDLPVYIRYGKRRFLGAQAQNVSFRGMFLSVRALTLPIGTPVELEFRNLGKGWLIPALVIHRDSSGIGVMYREPQPDLCIGIREQSAALLRPLPSAAAQEARPNQ